MSASVGNTINHALPRLHDIEAISRDIVKGVYLRKACLAGENIARLVPRLTMIRDLLQKYDFARLTRD
jgi:hypothetical protein